MSTASIVVTQAVVNRMLKHGKRIMLTYGAAGNVHCWISPLVVPAQQINDGLLAFEAVLQAAAYRKR